ncbi:MULTISPECIES: sensor histidine kinase [Sphingobium]|mgnify:CR=1 FL=1|jgi:signal transduction histidine kinase|uniref:histidine kinase n=1 Tax=Sphingobium yanoikuyae TaxID=13690 RepID=A0A0J9D390_SPHYA|nr:MULTISPECIES: HAMP domain-containing sensor histidine kinase [Sphingobium]ATP20711.1 ATP-binding protein [Sphingobium yanoikuyae]KMW31051.1 response regulator receiver protein [Sphingobium yanoikuyae]QCB38096.1 HAMP domain-containing histidine kinase [Sphingobium sp. PAMC28499]
MGFDRRFSIGLALRLIMAMACLAALAWALMTPDLGAVRILCAIGAAVSAMALWHHVRRANFELARFVEAIEFGDLQARFARPGSDSGFDQLGAALDRGIRKLRDDRVRLQEASRFYEALADDAPAALLTIAPDGRIEPVNKAARKLFNRHAGVRPDDYAPYGGHFAATLTALEPGRSQTMLIETDIGPQRVLIRCASLTRLGGATRVIAVQVIQQALNAVEVAAQSDLIRVLTHEIMNSMTPVTSLARTASDLMAQADDGGDPLIADARAAVDTLARRADGVMHFVETYRTITRPPLVDRRLFAARPFADELAKLFAADADRASVHLDVRVSPADHRIDADPDLLAQVVINLLRNAADAAECHRDRPEVSLSIAAISAGRTRIEVADNGPGVPEALRHDIFLPFFTTKKTGSGIGLSLGRQVLLAHDGTIEIDSAPSGGALFRLTL